MKDFNTEVMSIIGIANYLFRVEFQMRGLPHIHGVAWLDQAKIEDTLLRLFGKPDVRNKVFIFESFKLRPGISL